MDTGPGGAPIPHSSHWGAFSVLRRGDGIHIEPHPRDPDPAPLLGKMPASLTHRVRIATPMARRGWLEGGPGPDRRRGRDEWVPLSWPGRSVFPATVTLERSDIGASANDPLMVAMQPVSAPYGQSRDDHAIFSDLPRRGPQRGDDPSDFHAFWARGELTLPTLPWTGGIVRAFRRDPDRQKLPAPTGLDAETSKLAQACTGQLTVVQVERYDSALPRIRAFDPPA
nr:hypothetical protein [uncultured Rhodopila sp.]